jgi:hypothetical protein
VPTPALTATAAAADPTASQPWDWFHINAVHLDSDGNLLIDARDTWTTYKVNRSTGDICRSSTAQAS